MSLAIHVTLKCDGCGASAGELFESRATQIRPWVWRAQQQAGWTTLKRGMGHTQTHWCPECSQKGIKPVPRIVKGQ